MSASSLHGAEAAINPVWLAYAAVHGRTCDEQLAHDKVRWPGGAMCGFILWTQRKLRECSAAHPDAFMWGRLVDHAIWIEWVSQLPPNSEPDE